MILPNGAASAAAVQPTRDHFCQGHANFCDDAGMHHFMVQHETIALWHHPDVFPPSAFGLNFAERIDFAGCRSMADIGTGTGLLAILAGKKGVSEIKATDTSVLALALTDSNARELNGVNNIDTRQGAYFCDLDGTFDVITANLPQEILPPAYRSGLTPLQSDAIDGGGPGGNALLLHFLGIAPRCMHRSTKLYVIVNTVTDYRATLETIHRDFDPVLIWEGATGTKTFVRDHPDFFRELRDSGTVSLTEDAAGNWQARQFIYRLSLKP